MIRKAVIQAGGDGTRLRPVTLEIPKPLVPVQGLPILTWQARWFARHGVEHILVIIPPRWREAFEKWRNDLIPLLTKERLGEVSIELFVEPEPLGTMGAFVHELSNQLGDEPIFVTNGDELKGLDLSVLEAFHRRERVTSSNYATTIALIEVPNPSDYGVAELAGERIKAFHEKPANPPSNLINSGLYVIEPGIFSEVSREKKFLMLEKELFPDLASAGRLGGCRLNGPWFDCGTMERWERAIKEWPGRD
ncbi:MAG: nucleotidyltransferase family protein [Candidatus Uhrbacteria bacterium]|nr:nucleotidyltransferase family protein [Candidatus Uhrbacteria bacterium]